jgi:hypothetical protein
MDFRKYSICTPCPATQLAHFTNTKGTTYRIYVHSHKCAIKQVFQICHYSFFARSTYIKSLISARDVNAGLSEMGKA